MTTTGEICIDGVYKPHGPLLGTMSTPSVAGNGFKGGVIKSKVQVECRSSNNAIIGGDISSKKPPGCQVSLNIKINKLSFSINICNSIIN